MTKQVMAHIKIGGGEDGMPDPPKWVNRWFDCEVLVFDPDGSTIIVPELDYVGRTDNWYLRDKPELVWNTSMP